MKYQFILIPFILFSCLPEPEIPAEAKPYVDSFYHEGAIRGRIFDNDLKITLGAITEGGIKGSYHEGSIIIDSKFVSDHLNMRTRADSNYVKLVFWHELGHSIGQGHRGGRSIMNTGDFICCNGDFIMTLRYFNESKAHETEIINELFAN